MGGGGIGDVVLSKNEFPVILPQHVVALTHKAQKSGGHRARFRETKV